MPDLKHGGQARPLHGVENRYNPVIIARFRWNLNGFVKSIR
jgi:hypothetical protein